MNNIKLYREKKNIVHTPSEVVAAFEDCPALCFKFGDNRTATSRLTLFGGIWEVLPDAIITQCNLAIIEDESQIFSDEFLLILKNATEETTNAVYKIIEESEAVTGGFVIYAKKRAGIKICAYKKLLNDTPTIFSPKKANLMVDGEDLLLTVRNFSKSDRAALKADGFIKNVSVKENTEE